jgi:uncharacterized protein (UPF0262 family)
MRRRRARGPVAGLAGAPGAAPRSGSGVSENRLSRLELDPGSVIAASPEIEHDRQVAIYDLVEQNSFRPEGAERGPYSLRLSFEENRLVFDVEGPGYARRHMLSLTPFRRVMKDYFLVCESYYESVRNATPAQIEAVDMGRRGLHNEGSDLLRRRLEGKIEVDHETARRLFTLICALQRRELGPVSLGR